MVLSCSALKRAYRDRLRAACPACASSFSSSDRDEALRRWRRGDAFLLQQPGRQPVRHAGVARPGWSPTCCCRRSRSRCCARRCRSTDFCRRGPPMKSPPTRTSPAAAAAASGGTGGGGAPGVMALAVFLNVVLRYGFGSGIAASEETLAAVRLDGVHRGGGGHPRWRAHGLHQPGGDAVRKPAGLALRLVPPR